MNDSKKQTTGIIGIGNTSKTNITNIDQSVAPGQIVLTEKTYEKSLKTAIELRELQLQVAHDKEKVLLYAQIDRFKNLLADVPKAFAEQKAQIETLKATLEREGNEVGAEKLKEAITALEQGDFSKADALFAEIENREELAVQRAARAAFSRGKIAYQEVRWKDAAEHYARAAHLDPNFETLMVAQKISLTMGDPDSALSFGKKAEKVAIAEYEEESNEYATILNDLASSYEIKGEYTKAKTIYNQALEIYKKIFGEKHPHVAIALSNLGAVYYAQGKYTKAKPFAVKSLAINKKAFGENHSITAASFNTLAEIYREQGEYKKAKPLYRKAIRIYKKAFGSTHPEVTFIINNLALLHQLQGRHEKAESLFKDCLTIRKKVFGEDSQQTARILNNLGRLYYAQKQHVKADPMLLQAKQIFESTLGSEHSLTQSAKHAYKENRKHL